MPTTLRNTDILFNDGSTQSTAATAGGLVTTANVLNATAGATAGAVGTYMFAFRNTTGTVAFGSTVAGSALLPSAAIVSVGNGNACPWGVGLTSGAAQSGTWRAMCTYQQSAQASQASASGSGLWLRIS